VSVLGWSGLTVAATAAALLVPLAPAIGEDLRVVTCRSTGGSCGYVPATLRCAVLARDSGVASGLTPLSQVTSAGGSITTTKFLDGGAEVFVRDPGSARLAALARRRLTLSRSSGGPGAPDPRRVPGLNDQVGGGLAGGGLDGGGLDGGGLDGDVVGAVWGFPRHDDADAWRDRYLLAAAPVTAAAAGPGGAGVHQGVGAVVRSAGFDDPDRVRDPDGVIIEVGAQVTGAATYRQVSAGTRADAEPAAASAATTLTLDATGRASTSGPLRPVPTAAGAVRSPAGRPLADRSLAWRLGFGSDEPTTYSVRTDAAGRPTTLVLTGAVARTAGGSLRAPAELARIREQGESLGAASSAADDLAQRIRTRQTFLLDLRGPTNQRAFAQVFRAGPGLSVPLPAGAVPGRSAGAELAGPPGATTDREDQSAVATALVQRIAQDAVFVRTRVRGAGGPAGPPGAAGDQERETLMLQGFSQDFAVPASRLTRMPGCSR
jgi:hypothetical protein